MDLVLRCISSTSYSVVVNGCRGSNFTPTRGLRLGDPISSFLSNICVEGLSTLMRLTVREGRIKGSKVSRNGPSISHLLFVDDNILFGEANGEGAAVLKKILEEYASCS